VVSELVARLLAGDRRALGRIISLVESGSDAGREALRLLYSHTGRAHTIGVTGSPGSGKSTLVGILAREFRSRGRTVGVVAVDPSSPFSHGALLGDRIRMQELACDPGVFVRSMATRGSIGGLAAATGDVVDVLDAAGKDVILVETVGAGQDEVEIAGTAQTTLLVVTPGGGDEVQAMKAGIMEIADVLVVNKADLPNADLVAQQLASVIASAPTGSREVPVLRTSSSRNEGIVELADAIEEHRRYLEESSELHSHAVARARHQVLSLVRQRLLERVLRAAGPDGRLDELTRAVAAREMDPHTAAERLLD